MKFNPKLIPIVIEFVTETVEAVEVQFKDESPDKKREEAVEAITSGVKLGMTFAPLSDETKSMIISAAPKLIDSGIVAFYHALGLFQKKNQETA